MAAEVLGSHRALLGKKSKNTFGFLRPTAELDFPFFMRSFGKLACFLGQMTLRMKSIAKKELILLFQMQMQMQMTPSRILHDK